MTNYNNNNGYKKYPDLNEVLMAGTVAKLQKFQTGTGEMLSFELAVDEPAQNGSTAKVMLPCMVHPSMMSYVAQKIVPNATIGVKGRFQTASKAQPDGTYKKNEAVMVNQVFNAAGMPSFISLIGRITKDPSVKQTKNGKSYVQLTVANNDRFGEGTSFISASSFNKGTCTMVQKGMLSKGRKVFLSGSLTYKVGFGYSVSADTVELLDSQRQQNTGNQYQQNQQSAYNQYQAPDNAGGGYDQGIYSPQQAQNFYQPPVPEQNEQSLDITNDDLPF